MKVTDTECLDGKRHQWESIAFENNKEDWCQRETIWCRKCGSLSERIRDKSGKDKKWRRCSSGFNQAGYDITVPYCHGGKKQDVPDMDSPVDLETDSLICSED